VVGYDSSPAPGAYDVFVNPADTQSIGQQLVQMALALLESHRDLRVIVSPTTVGIAAGAKVLEADGGAGSVQLTGLGTPNSMRPYVRDGQGVCALERREPGGELRGDHGQAR